MAALQYTIKFTDTAKNEFVVTPYGADGPRSPTNPLLIDHAVRASTTLKLYGKGTPNYGEGFEQNMVYMLENFAGGSAPVYPIEGQLWYNNGSSGSPLLPAEMFVYNGGSSWDAVMLSTGTSPMTGPLTLSGNPTSNLHAAPKQYVDLVGTSLSAHISDTTVHLTSDQNVLLDGLNLPALSAANINTLVGVSTAQPLQTQIDSKIGRAGDTMDLNADLTFNGGEPRGLPFTPTAGDAAASKNYVDNQLGSGAGGDGVLTSTAWVAGQGTVGSVNDNILQLTVTYPHGSPNYTVFQIDGISRYGHGHTASEITFDNSVLTLYPADMQGVVEYVDTVLDTKAPTNSPTFNGGVTINGILTLSQNPSTDYEAATKQYVDSVVGGITQPNAVVDISRELQFTPGGSPLSNIYQVPQFVADSNSLFVYINGIKQYCNTYGGYQEATFDSNIIYVDSLSVTSMDNSIPYHFNLTVDGVGPTLVTIPALSSISTFGSFVSTLTTRIQAAGFNAGAEIINTSTIAIRSYNSGSTAAISITDPNTGSPLLYNYLFNIPSPVSIVRPEFVGDFSNPDSAFWTPDHIVISGNVTADFPVGKQFTIRNSSTDYGSYDGIYTVYTSGATYSSGPNETTIPVAIADNSAIPSQLLTTYSPWLGSPVPPAPVVSNAGVVYLTYIGGLTSLGTPSVGIDGDYREIVYVGSPSVPAQAAPGTSSTWIEFNYDIPANSRMEVNVFN